MELHQISHWRNLAAKAGAFFCLLAMLAVLDGLVSQFREPANVLRVLPGMNVEINGNLTAEVKGTEDLVFMSNSEHLTVSFEAVHKGYFLGGEMWRGELKVSSQIHPGEYLLTVRPKKAVPGQAAPEFRILVFPDGATLQQSRKSLIRRYAGLSPYGVAAACLPGILLGFGMVYYLSGRRESLLAQAGKAEIYRVLRRDDGYEVRFALGTVQGLAPGVYVDIMDEQGQPVGTAQVEETSSTDSVALAGTAREIKVGYLVTAHRA